MGHWAARTLLAPASRCQSTAGQVRARRRAVPVGTAPRPAAAHSTAWAVNNRIDSLYSTLLVPVGLLITLIAGGSVIGVVATLRSERRAAQLHDLAVSFETATQQRAEQVHVSFLDASQKTLTLVNDTLALAKEASERAARTMALKAHQSLDSVDENARDVLDNLRGSGYKRVVEEPGCEASCWRWRTSSLPSRGTSSCRTSS